MPRIRWIKPSFFANDTLAEVHPLGRLLFAGLWGLADREGRLEDRPSRIKVEVLPYDRANVDKLLNDLATRGFLTRYEVDGVSYIQITNFAKHQQPHYKEVASVIPPPPGHVDSGITPGGVTDEVRQRVFNRDGRKCLKCGATESLSLDHIVPRTAGGSHDESNLITLCGRCNSAKGKRDVDSMSGQGRGDVGSSSHPDPDPVTDPDPITDPITREPVSIRLSDEQEERRRYLHAQVRDRMFKGSTAPDEDYCEDLIRRGATVTDFDYAIQQALVRNVNGRGAFGYVRSCLETRVKDREAGNDPDRVAETGAGARASGIYPGKRRAGGVARHDESFDDFGDAPPNSIRANRGGDLPEHGGAEELPGSAKISSFPGRDRAGGGAW